MLTLSDLQTSFLFALAGQVRSGGRAAGTLEYYRRQLGHCVALVGADRRLDGLLPIDFLRAVQPTWHRVQAWQRLWAWGVEVELVARNPFLLLERPVQLGRRRVLSSAEWAELLRLARPWLRFFLQVQRSTLARPGEVRALHWDQWHPEASAFVLLDHKCLRRGKVPRPRVIVCNAAARALLDRDLYKTGFVCRNMRGGSISTVALRIAMRRLCRRAGLDDAGERVVAYTVRHTAATSATAGGCRDRILADLMGHSTTRTTARYQHLDIGHLREAAERIGLPPAA